MGILLVFDLTDERSFNSERLDLQTPTHFIAIDADPDNLSFADVRTWYANVEQHASEGVNKILIGNKCDWDDKRVVSEAQARELAEEFGIDYLETSAKSSIRVDDAFFTLARQIKARLIDSAEKSPSSAAASGTSDSVRVGGNTQNTESGGKCC